MAKPDCATRLSPWVLTLAISAGVLWADAATKEWAQTSLTEPVRLTSWLLLATQYNAGIFLGALPVATIPVLYWLFAGSALLYLGWRMLSADRLAVGAGYALVTGGLLGNALSRVNGAVVDCLGFGPLLDGKWAFANVADIAMLIGMAVLGAVMLRGKVRARRGRPT